MGRPPTRTKYGGGFCECGNGKFVSSTIKAKILLDGSGNIELKLCEDCAEIEEQSYDPVKPDPSARFNAGLIERNYSLYGEHDLEGRDGLVSDIYVRPNRIR